MGELKPLGSEKLSGDAKMKRILELTYYQSADSRSKSNEIVKESKTGVYGIVKEKDGYYVKKGLTESSLDYIGGLFMKNKNRFTSHNEALKKLEFLVEQESITEATKYVLKQNKPAAPASAPVEAPVPIPTTDTAPPAPDAGIPPADAEVPPVPEEGGDETAPENPNDYLKVIQKMTGRLTQKLSTYQDKLESKDIKYVLNMVLAAVDIDKMEESDKDEILSKFEDEEEGVDPTSDFPTDDNGETPAPQDEVSEIDGISALDELINTPLGEDNDDDDENTEFNTDDIDFLNDPEIHRAGKAAHKDIKKDLGLKDTENDELDSDNPLGATDEFEPTSDNDDNFPIYKGEDRELGEEDPISNTGQMPNMAADDVKELDINELTDMVNSSVKETLSKYFN